MKVGGNMVRFEIEKQCNKHGKYQPSRRCLPSLTASHASILEATFDAIAGLRRGLYPLRTGGWARRLPAVRGRGTARPHGHQSRNYEFVPLFRRRRYLPCTSRTANSGTLLLVPKGPIRIKSKIVCPKEHCFISFLKGEDHVRRGKAP